MEDINTVQQIANNELEKCRLNYFSSSQIF